jgi:UDP-N-acetylmuramoyl-tripeptide--D-alanyl-D-alanine ligase
MIENPTGRRVLHLVRQVRRRVRYLLAYIWRRLLFGTTVIAITGSVGKTTTRENLAAILSTRGRTSRTPNNENDAFGVPRTILAVRPWHRYAVIEVSADKPGQLATLARLLKPHVAIVLAVARTHTNAYPTLEAAAAEKEQLLGFLARGGAAVLNGDDVHVRAMATRCREPVVTFGASAECDVRASEASSVWPRRLTLSVRSSRLGVAVRTNLVGTHWVNSVTAAMAAAQVCGVPLAESARALARVEPIAGRMQPIALPNGAVVVRDEETGSPDTLDAMLKVLRESEAERRILVISDISDARAKSGRRQRDLGRIAAASADLAIFVSDHGRHAERAAMAAGMDTADCHHVPNLEKAAELLRAELRAGDLVFLKGRTTDHLSRVLFAQFGRIGCWRTSCKVRSICDLCSRLRPEFELERALSGNRSAGGTAGPTRVG